MPDVSSQTTPSGSLRNWRLPIAKTGEGPASAEVQEVLRQLIGEDLLAVINRLSISDRNTLLTALGVTSSGSAATHVDICSSSGDFRSKRAQSPPATVLVAVTGFTSNSANVREVDGGYVTTVRSGDIFIYDTTSPIWKRVYSASATSSSPSAPATDAEERVVFIPTANLLFTSDNLIRVINLDYPDRNITGHGICFFMIPTTASTSSDSPKLVLNDFDDGRPIERTDQTNVELSDLRPGRFIRLVYNGQEYASNIEPPGGSQAGTPGVSGSFERTLYRAADSQPPTPTTPHTIAVGGNPAIPTGWSLSPNHVNLDSPIWVTVQRVDRGSTTVTYTEPTPWGSSAVDAITFVGPARVSVNGDVITLNTTPSPTSYITGRRWQFFVPAESPPNSRSGSPRVQLGSLPAKQVLRTDLNAATASDIITGELVMVTYNGTAFVSDIEPPASGATGSPGVAGSFERSLYQRAHAQPSTPAVPGTVVPGDPPGLPAGWSEQPPTGQSSQPTWVTIQRVPRGLSDVSYTEPVIAFQGITTPTTTTDFKMGWSEDLTVTDAELSVSSVSGSADIPSADGPSAYLVVWRSDAEGGDPDHIYVNGVDWREAYFGDAVDFTSDGIAGKAVFTNVRQTRIRLAGATVRVA